MRGRALFIHALQGMKPHHAGTLLQVLGEEFYVADDLKLPDGILSISRPLNTLQS